MVPVNLSFTIFPHFLPSGSGVYREPVENADGVFTL